ncbi:MAG: hypothetical protein HWN68_16790 [Desulfobacterales bacterium]|nr:hypothetical protein [Desulfobacterales bacterium]
MTSKKTKIAAAIFIIAILAGVSLLSYKKLGVKNRSFICASSYINLILEMHRAQTLLDPYVENEKSPLENKHLIKRHLDEARLSLNRLLTHSGESASRLNKLKKAIDDWEGFSNSVIIALKEISEKGSANDTGEIQAFSKLAIENFIDSMFIVLSTFSNMGPEPPINAKEGLELNLSQKDREYFSSRLNDAYKDICFKEKEKKRLSGIEWSVVGTKNFIDNQNIGLDKIFNCESID